MMKLSIGGIICIILAVQAQSYKWQLIEEGDPFTHVCDKPSAKWRLNRVTVASCKNCPLLPCTVHKYYNARITAFCNKTHPVFHSNSIPVHMDYSRISCTAHRWKGIHLRVGRYDGRIHPEHNYTVALDQNNYTLVFDKRQDGPIEWYNKQGERLAAFHSDCTDVGSYYEKKRLHFTCDEKTSKLHIKNVTLSDDGEIFACSEENGGISLFTLTVHVPVTSVFIQPQSQVLVENEEAIFICIVEESIPIPSFEWIIVYHNGSSQEIHQKFAIFGKTKWKIWQTNSTLEMKITRDFQKIMCKATINNLPWTNSEYQPLYVNVPVTSVYIQPQSQVLVENDEAMFICLVEESIPIPSFEWIIVYHNGSSQGIHQTDTISTTTGRIWQTNSTLKLKITRDFQKIMCKATINNLPWTHSEYQSLDIKVPVTSVSIQPKSQLPVENEEASFICKVEESKPEASFEWTIVYQNGSTQDIHQDYTTICKKVKGTCWQTNSTLEMKIRRDFQKIMCKATIENLPWTNSEYQSLYIKELE